jgi:restriction endonuclease S subunit
MIKRKRLSDVSDIMFGLYAQPSSFGSAIYLQVRQFSGDGRQIVKSEEYIDINEKNASHILKEGDVLFVGKGNRLFSWCYSKTDDPVVASSIFFVLRPDKRIICPEYLSAILNAPQSKAFFLQMGSGTNIFSIRKSELGAFEVPIPAMPEQIKIAALAALHQEEVALAEQLIEQKRNFYTAIISKLIK